MNRQENNRVRMLDVNVKLYGRAVLRRCLLGTSINSAATKLAHFTFTPT
jgi:hypothetical protein